MLASTDLALVTYYRLEFVIRDAKQHTGLAHGQARSQDKIDFHLNASLTATNLLRLLAARSGSTLGSMGLQPHAGRSAFLSTRPRHRVAGIRPGGPTGAPHRTDGRMTLANLHGPLDLQASI